MKRFLTIMTAFVLMVCIGFFATGCTMKLAGKTFKYESIVCEINTTNLTAEEKAEFLANLNEGGIAVNDTMTDAELTEKYNSVEYVKTNMQGMLETLQTESIVFGKKDITYYENGIATEDKTYYKQDGKNIVVYTDEALTNKSEEAEAQGIKINGKKLVMTLEVEKGLFVTYTLSQVK